MEPVSPVLLKVQASEIVYAKDQPEYRPLPAVVTTDESKTAITRWKLTWPERLYLLVTGNLYFQQMTFGQKLQPILPSTEEPEIVLGQ